MNSDSTDQQILEIIRSTGSVGIDEIERSTSLPRRTLQRRIESLGQAGRIKRLGRARATVYQIAPQAVVPQPVISQTAPTRVDDYRQTSVLREDSPLYSHESKEAETLELAPESLELRGLIRRPLHLRKPVGYRLEFLEAYEPNQTFYLPQKLREELHSVGQSAYMAEMPPGTYARQVLSRLLIDLSWNSSRLEGNTYSLLETEHLLTLGKSDDPKRWREAQMILNHKDAIEFLVEAPSELGYNRYTLLNLHAILADGLLENSASEGRLRQIPVGVSGTVFHPLNVPQQIEESFDTILKKTAAISDPLEQSFFLMVHLPYLQPFEDVNKRTSRLAANLPLIQQNMSPLSFVDVPLKDYTDGILSVYELNRVELLRDVFAWAYRRSSARYAAICRQVGAPDAIRVGYRMEIRQLISGIVTQRMTKPQAVAYIQQWATRNVSIGDRARFVQTVEELLLELNERNIARFRVRPAEFAAWWQVWTGRAV
ncbi:MAG: Fic family protein [Prosthecobacter sp.]